MKEFDWFLVFWVILIIGAWALNNDNNNSYDKRLWVCAEYEDKVCTRLERSINQ